MEVPKMKLRLDGPNGQAAGFGDSNQATVAVAAEISSSVPIKVEGALLSTGAAPASVFHLTEINAADANGGLSKRGFVRTIGVVLLLCLVGVAIMQYREASDSDASSAPPAASTHSEAKIREPVVSTPKQTKPTVGLTSRNPYSSLALELDIPVAPLSNRLKTGDEEVLNEELSSDVYYHQYVAVEKIVAARKLGSESLLREALASGKFWLRMNAVMGLADLGYKVSKGDINLALGNAHAELRARFFERFTNAKRCPAGCRLVMRGALEKLSPIGRFSALSSLAKFPSLPTQKIMVAATFDEDQKIRNFAREWLLKHPISETEWYQIFNGIFNSQTVAKLP